MRKIWERKNGKRKPVEADEMKKHRNAHIQNRQDNHRSGRVTLLLKKMWDRQDRIRMDKNRRRNAK